MTLSIITRQGGRGRGYIDLGRPLAHSRRHGAIMLPELARLSPRRDLFTGLVFDQGPVGSCAAHGSAGAIDTTLKVAGAPLGFTPSPDALYRTTLSLMRGAGEFSGSLADYGSDMTYVEQAYGLFGVKPMGAPVSDSPGGPTRFSDCTIESLTKELSRSETEVEGQKVMVGAYELPRTLDAICRAIDAGYCVLMATFVDTAFEDWTASKGPVGAPNTSDRNGGGHSMRIDGYDTLSTGERILIATNSWGKTWGTSGRFVASRAWVENPAFSFAAAVAVHPEVAQ